MAHIGSNLTTGYMARSGGACPLLNVMTHHSSGVTGNATRDPVQVAVVIKKVIGCCRCLTEMMAFLAHQGNS